jgi:hypothetical protein
MTLTTITLFPTFARKRETSILFLRGLKTLGSFPPGGKSSSWRHVHIIVSKSISNSDKSLTVLADGDLMQSRFFARMPVEAMLIDVMLVISCAACMVHRRLFELLSIIHRGAYL